MTTNREPSTSTGTLDDRENRRTSQPPTTETIEPPKISDLGFVVGITVTNYGDSYQIY
jgi:hypothetical protein